MDDPPRPDQVPPGDKGQHDVPERTHSTHYVRARFLSLRDAAGQNRDGAAGFSPLAIAGFALIAIAGAAFLAGLL